MTERAVNSEGSSPRRRQLTPSQPADHAPPSLLDAATRTAMAQVAVMCWFLYSLGPIVLLIRDDLQLSRAEAGLHSSLVLLGGLTSGLLSPVVVRRFGRHDTRRLGLCALAEGCAVMATGDVVWVTLAGAYLCGLGITVAVSAVNASIVEHHGHASGSALSLLNAVGATLGICAPLVFTAALSSGATWHDILLMTGTAAVLTIFAARRRFPSDAHAQEVMTESSNTAATDPVAPLPRTTSGHGVEFRFLLFALTAAMLVEFSTNIYAIDLICVNGHLTVAAAATYAAAFIAGFAAGRWTAIPLALRTAPLTLGLWAAGISAAAAASLVIVHSPVLIAIALFTLGIGTGPGYPILASAALAATTSDRDKASALIAVVGGGGAAVAPFVLGMVADGFGISAVFAGLSGIATLSTGVLLYAMFYNRQHGGWVPKQRNLGV